MLICLIFDTILIPAFQSLQDPVLFLLWFLIGSNQDELSQEKFVCQFCTKDLSHFNSARKTQHLNRCMDKVGITCNTKIEKLISADLKKSKRSFLRSVQTSSLLAKGLNYNPLCYSKTVVE